VGCAAAAVHLLFLCPLLLLFRCGCSAVTALVVDATHLRSLGGNYIPSMLFHRIPSGARALHAAMRVCVCVCVGEGQRKHSRSGFLPPSFRLHLCCPRECVSMSVCVWQTRRVVWTQPAPWVRQRTLLYTWCRTTASIGLARAVPVRAYHAALPCTRACVKVGGGRE
jgi:hypothetical protein